MISSSALTNRFVTLDLTCSTKIKQNTNRESGIWNNPKVYNETIDEDTLQKEKESSQGGSSNDITYPWTQNRRTVARQMQNDAQISKCNARFPHLKIRESKCLIPSIENYRSSISCFLKIWISYSTPHFHFMFLDRYWSHISKLPFRDCWSILKTFLDRSSVSFGPVFSQQSENPFHVCWKIFISYSSFSRMYWIGIFWRPPFPNFSKLWILEIPRFAKNIFSENVPGIFWIYLSILVSPNIEITGARKS